MGIYIYIEREREREREREGKRERGREREGLGYRILAPFNLRTIPYVTSRILALFRACSRNIGSSPHSGGVGYYHVMII